MVFILSSLWLIRIRGSWKLPDVRDWLWGNLDLVLMDEAILSNDLIQLSVYGVAGLPPCCLTWGQTYVRGHGSNGDLLQKGLYQHHCIQCPWPHVRPLLTHTSAGDSWTHTGKSGSVSCGITAPFSWVPGTHKALFVPSKSLFSQSGGNSVIKSHWPPKSNSLRVLSPFAGSAGWEICCGS